jgi:hypothetical protein
MKREGSSQYPQQPATGPYPEPDDSRPHFPTSFFKIQFNSILQSTGRAQIFRTKYQPWPINRPQ